MSTDYAIAFWNLENRFVLERLTAALAPLGRGYQIVHHDTNPQRGLI